jgi:hypothetical protein
MKENIELNHYREFGDILTDTFKIIKQNFKPLLKSYFVICGLFLMANIIVAAAVNTNRGDASLHTLAGLIELVFDFINYSVLSVTVLSYLALYKEKGNQAPALLEVWGYFKYYFFRAFLAQFLLTIAVVIGFFLCFVPGIYLAVVYSLVVPIMVIENGNIEYSFKRAFKIIKENWWFTFGIILLVSIITLLITLVLILPPLIFYGTTQWLTGENLDNTAGIIQSIVTNLCQVLWMIPIISTTLVYYSLTEEKEGNSLIDRIKMFGKNTPGTDQISSEQY